MELWQVYGGRSEYLSAPFEETTRIRLALEAKWKVENDKQAEYNEQLEKMRERR